MENNDAARILFHAYAWGDADRKKEAGLISEAMYHTLELCICTDQPVDIVLLVRAYPEECGSLYRYAAGKQIDAWSYLAVSRYWRTRHEGNTRVWRARFIRPIDSLPELRACKVRELGSRFENTVYNPRNLVLTPECEVYLHVHTIAEQVPHEAA